MEKSIQLMIIVCSTIVVVAISSLAMLLPSKQNQEEIYAIHPQKKEFWLFTSEINFNETKMGMPHDVFSQSSITVNEGDNVIIHFFNTEPDGGDKHSFTMYGNPYDLNVILNPGENKTISFNATKVGAFPYECTFHQPTMRGQLVVLASSEP